MTKYEISVYTKQVSVKNETAVAYIYDDQPTRSKVR